MSYNPEARFVLQQLKHDPKKHLPQEGIPKQPVYLEKGLPVYAYVAAKTSLGSRHRLKFVCPHCGGHFSVGRAGQHLKAHASTLQRDPQRAIHA